MVETAITTRALSKAFAGGVRALDGLDLTVPTGSVCGLLGRNGAGKTTALRILMGLLNADAGEALVLGEDLRGASREQRARVAYVAQEPRLTGRLPVAGHAYYLAHFYPAFDEGLARSLARRFEVDWERRLGALSGGARRKAAVLLALACRPEVLLLDEPAAGLDPLARRELSQALIDTLAEREACSVLLSTHLVGDLERLADRVAVVDLGRVLRQGSVEGFCARFRRVQVIFDGAPPLDFAIPGALVTDRTGSVVSAVAEFESEEQVEALRSQPGARVDFFPLSLEDVFIELVDRRPGESWPAAAAEGALA